MAVFRVEKTKNYTVMANHHLQNKELSLKAKGLLSVMLSVSDDWVHSITGYAGTCKDGVDGITSAIKELEAQGYIVRRRIRNEKGQLRQTEYTIYEQPKLQDTQLGNEPNTEKPILEKPILDNPILEKPYVEKPILDNPVQYSTKELSTKELNTKGLNINVLNPNQSNPYIESTETNIPFGYEMMGFKNYAHLKETIYENIEYEHFKNHRKSHECTRIEEIADIIIETICSTSSKINIAGQYYPEQLVKEKMLKINSCHIEYVFECMKDNASDIRNIKRYLLATLFNAPSTIDNYYTAKVHHDLHY